MCDYCPVSLSPRNKQEEYVDQRILDFILRDLIEIEYEGAFCLNLYNEPTSNREHLLDTIKKIKKCLPKASIYFSTNGDYLNRQYLDEIFDAGLSSLTITMHMPPGKKYNNLDVMNRLMTIGAKLGLEIQFSRLEKSDSLGKLVYEKGDITIFSRDFEKLGVNRGGAMKNIEVKVLRNSPCDRPFDNFTVDFKGNFYPCCQFYPDIQSSEKYQLGSILNFESIFDAYGSLKMSQWRKELFTFGRKKGPCAVCLESERIGSDAEVEGRW